jgi:hypothetical protein
VVIASVVPLARATRSLSLSEVRALARQYGVPAEDVLLIGLNLYGIGSADPRHRARLSLVLSTAPHTTWNIVGPLNAEDSPFRMVGRELLLDDTPIGSVLEVESDEAVGGYFRDGGRAATLNPNARSRCVGCAFCPNTLEAAADPRFSDVIELGELFDALREQHPRHDLSELVDVTVSTGCFEREDLAVSHLVRLRAVLDSLGVDARLGFLSSVIRTDQGFAQVAERVAPFILRLTVECFSRRDLLLKASKASLEETAMADVLRRARAHDLGTSFTYIVGLDPLAEMRRGVTALLPHVSEFPGFQIYQAHNRIMSHLRVPGADQLAFYLEARRVLEEELADTDLRPKAWQCYRSLWYHSYADEQLVPLG